MNKPSKSPPRQEEEKGDDIEKDTLEIYRISKMLKYIHLFFASTRAEVISFVDFLLVSFIPIAGIIFKTLQTEESPVDKK